MRHRLLGAAALVLLLGVSGCSDDPDPEVTDPSPSPITSTPTGTGTTSDPPATSATAEPEPESAEDFIRRYARAEAEMQNTGNTGEYLLITDTCESCESLAETVAGYYGDGGSVRWDGWEIRKIERYNGSRTEYAVTVDSPPTTFREKRGSPERRIEGGRVTYLLTLVRDGESWLIDETAQLS